MTHQNCKPTLHFLLRYGDQLRRVDTVKEHLKVLAELGHVWWGKFGSGISSHIVQLAREQIATHNLTRVYLVQGGHIRFRAQLLDIVGGGANRKYPAPMPNSVPKYYRSEACSVWFKLTNLVPEAPDQLRHLELYQSPGYEPRLAESMKGLIYAREVGSSDR